MNNQTCSLPQRYNRLVECLFSNLTIFDLNGCLVDVNEQAAKMFGYESAKEILDKEKGKSFLRWTPAEMKEEAMKQYELLLETGKLDPYETISIKKDGTKFPIEATAAVVFDSKNKPKEIIFLVRDITYQKKMEKLLENNKEIVHQFHKTINSNSITQEDLCKDMKEQNVNLFAFKWDGISIYPFAEFGDNLLSENEKMHYGLFLTTLVGCGTEYHEGLYGPFPYNSKRGLESITFSKMIPADNVVDPRMDNFNYVVIALIYPSNIMKRVVLLRGILELIFTDFFSTVSNIKEISSSSLEFLANEIKQIC